MDLSEVLSKACTDVLRFSVNEDFRKEFINVLGVTNATDAEEVLANHLKTIKAGPQRNLTPRKSSVPKTANSGTTNGQQFQQVSSRELTGVESSKFKDVNPNLRTDSSKQNNNPASFSQTQMNEELDDYGFSHMVVDVDDDTPSIEIPEVSLEKKIDDLLPGQKETELEVCKSITNKEETLISQKIVHVDRQNDNFDFWKIAYSVIGATNCSSAEVGSVSSTKPNHPDRSPLKLPNSSNSNDSIGLTVENQQVHQSETYVEEDEFGFWDIDLNGSKSSSSLSKITDSPLRVAATDDTTGHEEVNKDTTTNSNHSEFSQSILRNEHNEDDLQLQLIRMNVSSDSTMAGFTTSNEAFESKVKATELSQSVAQSGDEDDEFGFWNFTDDRNLKKKVVKDSSNPATLGFSKRHDNIELEQVSTSSNEQSQSVLKKVPEEDEFGFWSLSNRTLQTSLKNKVVNDSTSKTEDEINKYEDTVHEPSQSILKDVHEEDEFGFWNLVDDSSTKVKKVFTEKGFNVLASTHDAPEIKLKNIFDCANQTLLSQPDVQNEEGDEFGFWDINLNVKV